MGYYAPWAFPALQTQRAGQRAVGNLPSTSKRQVLQLQPNHAMQRCISRPLHLVHCRLACMHSSMLILPLPHSLLMVQSLSADANAALTAHCPTSSPAPGAASALQTRWVACCACHEVNVPPVFKAHNVPEPLRMKMQCLIVPCQEGPCQAFSGPCP